MSGFYRKFKILDHGTNFLNFVDLRGLIFQIVYRNMLKIHSLCIVQIFPKLLDFCIQPENQNSHSELHSGLMLTLESWSKIMAKQDNLQLNLSTLHFLQT